MNTAKTFFIALLLAGFFCLPLQARAAVIDDDNAVAALAVVAPFLFSAVIGLGVIGIAAAARIRRNKLANETLRALIEKGQPLTPELIDSVKQLQSPDNPLASRARHMDLRAGLVLVAAGAGVWWLGARAGAVILLVGVALLVCDAIIAWLQSKSGNRPSGAAATNNESSPKS